MEARDEKERYFMNPLRLVRCGLELAHMALRAVDDNLYEFNDARPYNEANFPPIRNVEAPVASEDELST